MHRHTGHGRAFPLTDFNAGPRNRHVVNYGSWEPPTLASVTTLLLKRRPMKNNDEVAIFWDYGETRSTKKFFYLFPINLSPSQKTVPPLPIPPATLLWTTSVP